MAEKVLIVPLRSRGRAVLMDARVARALVAHGSFGYVDETEEPKPVTKPKKRIYKRRDMKAED